MPAESSSPPLLPWANDLQSSLQTGSPPLVSAALQRQFRSRGLISLRRTGWADSGSQQGALKRRKSGPYTCPVNP